MNSEKAGQPVGEQEERPALDCAARPAHHLRHPHVGALGVYLAFTIPVAVFPSTDFPRIVVGVDNGVMPIDQMLVTVTRPIEEAVNSVPGCDHRALHHQPRIGGNRPVFSTGTWTCSRRWSW